MTAKERDKIEELTEKVIIIEERQGNQEKVQKKILSSQQDFHDKFDRLTHHLIGDKAVNRKGIIEEFDGVKIRLSRVEKAYAIGAGIITAVFIWGEKIISVFKIT